LFGGEIYSKLHFQHAGDDVIVSGEEDAVGSFVKRMVGSTVRLNPSKQGLGDKCGEFLRVSYTKKGCGGYLARAISSVVSGNWVSEKTLSSAEAVTNYANMAWTLMVRSGVRYAGSLLTTTVERRVPEVRQFAFEVCTGGISVMGSPVYGRQRGTSKMLMLSDSKKKSHVKEDASSFATDQFIKDHVSDGMLQAAGVSKARLRNLMLEVSYKDRERKVISGLERVVVIECPAADVVDIQVVSRPTPVHGSNDVPAAYKVLGGLVGSVDWRWVFEMVTGKVPTKGHISDDVTWPCINAGTLGVTELANLRKGEVASICVYTDFPVRV